MKDIYEIGQHWKFKESDGTVTTGKIVKIYDDIIVVDTIYNETKYVVRQNIKKILRLE
jgi:uncharacterized protein (UPF0333 family)